ncbi:MAG: adenylyl-sulfate kinase [Desulfovibrio sp.]
MAEKKYIQRHRGEVFREDRQRLNGHKSAVFWFTGLSGSGKSTIAHAVEKKLFDLGRQATVFDGDNVRHGLCSDLSFSPEGRSENIRRIAEVTKLFAENGTVCMCAFITPRQKYRKRIQDIIGSDYYEIYVKCSVEECENRDAKGYYKLAREGKIKNYTGISAPYDVPESPALVVDTEVCTLDECVATVFSFVEDIIKH